MALTQAFLFEEDKSAFSLYSIYLEFGLWTSVWLLSECVLCILLHPSSLDCPAVLSGRAVIFLQGHDNH